MAPSFVLDSKQSSTYPRGYASGCFSSAALLLGKGRVLARLGRAGGAIHFEHPQRPVDERGIHG